MATTESFVGSHPAEPAPSASSENAPAEIRRSAEDVATSMKQLYRVGDAFLGRQAHDRPYLVLGTAAGIGFVLGGGLAWKMAGTLMKVAGRMAAAHAVDSWLQSNSSGG